MLSRVKFSKFFSIKKGLSILTKKKLYHYNRSYNSSLASSIQCNLNDLQLELQKSALEFMEKELKPNARKWDQEHYYPREVIRKIGSLGYGGLYVPESSGGIGLSRLDSTLIFEALAQGCVPTTAIITIHNMTAWMISKYGNKATHSKYLDKMITCQLMGSYCLTEPNSGSDAAALETSAILDNNHYIIKGSKCFISGAGESDVYVTMVRTGKHKTNGITCVVIPKDLPGVSFGVNEHKMGWHSSPTKMVYFDNVKVPIENRLGEEGEGFKIALSGLDGGRLNIAATSLGAAHRCLEDAINYTQERKAFGQEIASFQNTQFELAHMFTKLHSSRLLLRNAALLLDQGDKNKSMYCAMAKQEVTDNGFNICNRALQLFGGYGYLSEYNIERFVRDVRVNQILEGTNEIMKVIIARKLLDKIFSKKG